MERIPELDIFGENASHTPTKVRKASRAIIFDGDRILLSYAAEVDVWMLPGGGLEGGESPKACCIREVAEETGLKVIPRRCFFILNEYFGERKYRSYYYLCTKIGETPRRPTDWEREVGMRPVWTDFDKAKEIFSRYDDFQGSDDRRRGMYRREYSALEQFSKLREAGEI